MPKVDKRGKLQEQPFDFQITKDGRLLIYWGNRIIMTLKGKAADNLMTELEDADEAAIQLALAKITGNFKHGNERNERKDKRERDEDTTF